MVYPCGDCGKNCTRFCVVCENCESWFHFKCQKLTQDQFTTLNASSNCDYIGINCTQTINGKFDYENSLDYELNSSVSHLQCTKIIWQSKNQKEKDTLLQRFLTHGFSLFLKHKLDDDSTRVKITTVDLIKCK
jgi:hypothetical protein